MADTMTPERLRYLVLEEVAALGGRPPETDHDIDLERCLVAPFRVTLTASIPGRPTLDAWVVLDEDPGAPDGYLIVYDEERETFGLAIKGEPMGFLVGLYGTFLNTLAAM